jgi:glycosyltransferase involved in cell wall biosynthesis
MKILAVTNLYPTPDRPASGTFVEQQIKSLRRAGLEVEVMFVDREHRGMSCYLGLGRRALRRLARFDADIVHAMYGGVLADAVTRAVRDRPTVVSFCGSDLLGEKFSGRVRRLLSGIGVIASRSAARRASGVIIKAANLERFLPQGVDAAKVRVIPNGVDLTRFISLDRYACRRKLGWSSDRFHVLFPANVGDPVKRPELARAAVDLVNAGGARVELHPLQGVAHEQVPVWLNASDAVLLTSAHEGSPNIIKEALACRVPIVSVDVGDVSERIGATEGCYIAAATALDLASKLITVLSGARRLRSRDGIDDLSLEKVAARLESFYREVLRSAAGASRAALAEPAPPLSGNVITERRL